jgi:Chaperone for flagella basal body P-ring formation
MDAAELEAQLVALATERCEAARVEVRWLGVDPARLDPAGTGAWEGDPCGSHPTLALWWTVPGGTDRLTVRPQLSIWVEGPVAAEAAAVGERVRAVPGLVPWSSLAGGAAFPGATGVATRALEAGDPLTVHAVVAPPDVPCGEKIVLRVRAGALEIRSEGRLLEDGRVGQPVRVWVAATDTATRGVLSADRTVDL